MWIPYQPTEWEQQRDDDEWERICAMTPEELDADLVAHGADLEALDIAFARLWERIETMIEERDEHT